MSLSIRSLYFSHCARSSTDRVADFESEGCRFESYRCALISTTYDDSGTHQESLAHTLPTSEEVHAVQIFDPDLALIVAVWDRLADDVKRRLIELLPNGEDPAEVVD